MFVFHLQKPFVKKPNKQTNKQKTNKKQTKNKNKNPNKHLFYNLNLMIIVMINKIRCSDDDDDHNELINKFEPKNCAKTTDLDKQTKSFANLMGLVFFFIMFMAYIICMTN